MVSFVLYHYSCGLFVNGEYWKSFLSHCTYDAIHIRLSDSLLSVHIIGSAGASVGQADGDTA